MNVSRLLYKTTGLMPKKEIVRTSKNIGRTLANEMKPGDKVDVCRVQELLRGAIGTKKAGKVVVADDFETFKKYASNLGLDECSAKSFFYNSKSAVLSNPKDKSILLSLRTSAMDTGEALNTTAHELEHVLFRSVSSRAAFEKLYLKIRGNKYLENFIKKYGLILNQKTMNLQGGLIYKGNFAGFNAIGGYTSHPLSKKGLTAQLGLSTEKMMQRSIRSIVKDELVKDDPKLNMKILKTFRGILKDESRAYKSGGAVERYWSESIGAANPNANKSEMCGALYDEALSIVNKEIKDLRKNRIKSLFGIKPKQDVPSVVKPEIKPDVVVVEKEVLKNEDISPEILEELMK